MNKIKYLTIAVLVLAVIGVAMYVFYVNNGALNKEAKEIASELHDRIEENLPAAFK